MDKFEKRWLLAGSLFLALVVFLCVSSPYWDIWFAKTSCQCPWCLAEEYAKSGEYEIEYKYGSDSMSVVVRPVSASTCPDEAVDPAMDESGRDMGSAGDQEAVPGVDGESDRWDEAGMMVSDIYDPDVEGYWVINDNGQDVVLYADGYGRYWYVDSDDGYPVVTDRLYEGTVPMDDVFGGYDEDADYFVG